MLGSSLYIAWKDLNEIGIPIIDEQHRGIVSTINTFYYFSEGGHGHDALQPTVKVLEQYTKLHFQTEETLMKQASFSGFNEHVAFHRLLFEEIGIKYRQSVADRDNRAFLHFLRTWWVGHINNEDRKYADCVRTSLGLT